MKSAPVAIPDSIPAKFTCRAIGRTTASEQFIPGGYGQGRDRDRDRNNNRDRDNGWDDDDDYDYDRDGKMDLVVTGEYMPVRIFHNTGGTLKEVTEACGLSNSNGWWNRLAIADVNGDGYKK